MQRGLAGATGGTALGFSHPEQLPITGARVPRLVWDNFSLECWFRTTTGMGATGWNDGSPLIDGDVLGTTAADYGLDLSSDGRVQYGEVSDTPLLVSSAGYNNGAWHHVVVTRIKATGVVVLYLDGTQVATATGPTTSLNAAGAVGLGQSPYASAGFEGLLDEVAVYDHVLTQTRITAHYHAGSGN